MAPPSIGEEAYDREETIQEVVRGDELMSQLHTLRQLAQKGDSRSEFAGRLLRRVSRDLAAGLSALKCSGEPAGGCDDLRNIDEGSSSSRSPAGGSSASENLTSSRKQKEPRRERKHRSWKIETCAPYDDGYEWRKYGQKYIKNSKFPRSYYRCTYGNELNCPATKQVQQKDRVEPPMFLVIYTNKHTCDAASASTTTQVQLASPPRDPCLLSFHSSTHKEVNQDLQPSTKSLANPSSEDNQIPAHCPVSPSSYIQPPFIDMTSTESEKTTEPLPVASTGIPDVLLSMSPFPDLDFSDM